MKPVVLRDILKLIKAVAGFWKFFKHQGKASRHPWFQKHPLGCDGNTEYMEQFAATAGLKIHF
jgi:hypothetical protein